MKETRLILKTLRRELDTKIFPLDWYYMTLPPEKNTNTDSVIKAENMGNHRIYTFTKTKNRRYEYDDEYCHFKGLEVEVSPEVFYFISQILVFRPEIHGADHSEIINLVSEPHRNDRIINAIRTMFTWASIARF